MPDMKQNEKHTGTEVVQKRGRGRPKKTVACEPPDATEKKKKKTDEPATATAEVTVAEKKEREIVKAKRKSTLRPTTAKKKKNYDVRDKKYRGSDESAINSDTEFGDLDRLEDMDLNDVNVEYLARILREKRMHRVWARDRIEGKKNAKREVRRMKKIKVTKVKKRFTRLKIPRHPFADNARSRFWDSGKPTRITVHEEDEERESDDEDERKRKMWRSWITENKAEDMLTLQRCLEYGCTIDETKFNMRWNRMFPNNDRVTMVERCKRIEFFVANEKENYSENGVLADWKKRKLVRICCTLEQTNRFLSQYTDRVVNVAQGIPNIPWPKSDKIRQQYKAAAIYRKGERKREMRRNKMARIASQKKVEPRKKKFDAQQNSMRMGLRRQLKELQLMEERERTSSAGKNSGAVGMKERERSSSSRKTAEKAC